MNFNTILFDLDGTLTDPAPGITNSVIYALKKLGIEERNREKLYAFIGPPLTESFEKYYGFSKEKARLAVEYYREYFAPTGLFENSVFPGIEEMLKSLKNADKRIILATSKPKIFADKILQHFSIFGYFNFTVGSNLDGTLTNKSEVISVALKHAKIKNLDQVCMVGDRMHDILGATNNGITPIGVTFGYGSEEELKSAGAQYIINSVVELTDFLIK